MKPIDELGPTMKYNAHQVECIECDDNLLIVAPPGSGKTGTLVAKAVRILQRQDAVVGMVTFTDAAAREMRHRIAEAVGPVAARRVYVETFHKHAILQLRASGMLGRLVTPQEQFGIVMQAISDLQEPMSVPDALALIEKAKASLDFTGEELPLVSSYQRILSRYRARDLMDVLRLAVVGMREGTVKPLKVTHLLGDEFQDADKIQLEWIMCHGAAGAVLTCVGDDDQAIYSWRGSMGYEGMQEFKSRAAAKAVNLQVNYRSLLEIIQASQAVIARNVNRIPKEVLGSRKGKATIEVLQAGTKADEADLVVARIVQDLGTAQPVVVPRGRWAVIARTNMALVPTAVALRAAGIPYSRPGGKDALEGSFHTLLLLLTAIQSGDPLTIDNALLGMGYTWQQLEVLHRGLGDEYDAILEGALPNLDDFHPEDAARLRRLCGDLLPAWRERARLGQYRLVVDAAADYFVKAGLVAANEKDDFEHHVGRLKSRKGSLAAMAAPFLEPQKTEAGDGVVLHTMHSSKGLEYDHVTVIRCNEGTIPPTREPVNVEEERRLFYVAMTRARLGLRIISASGAGRPSCFVDNVPGEVLELGL